LLVLVKVISMTGEIDGQSHLNVHQAECLHAENHIQNPLFGCRMTIGCFFSLHKQLRQSYLSFTCVEDIGHQQGHKKVHYVQVT